MAVGNIVRRVLGLIREVSEGDGKDGNTTVYNDAGLDTISGPKGNTLGPTVGQHVASPPPNACEDMPKPTKQSTTRNHKLPLLNTYHPVGLSRDLKPGIIEGLQEILDELNIRG
ncbi:hypothetical protein BDZ91DRAFT_757750 [Kalaharituber pfeilii]|nr:hypothetical protein BDZ91DRAFT_757750 [Kalaharituber pfeilii]